ncbi:MAG TPA: transglutaminase-like domain-containing protein, partial [Phycisphaerae bacterium]
MRGRSWFRCPLATALAGVVALLAGCQTTGRRWEVEPEPVPDVVTADIQAGIEKHIEEQTDLGGGYFTLPYEGQALRLKLVRVHTEYLANLGPRQHFACVDLANTDGNVYDVDFFLEGDPGSMRVTQTLVHKRNGRPFYVWEQNPDGTWARAPVSTASSALLGVVEGFDSFEFVYQLSMPQLGDAGRMWIPLPSNDQFQTIEMLSIRTPGRREILTDRRYGNKVLCLTLTPQDSGKPLALRFHVERREKAAYRDPASRPEDFLAPERLVPNNPEFGAIASEVLAGKNGELLQARALYDHTIDRMRYMRYGSGWGKGDAVYACESRTGNCTDFHAYFIGLCRAAGIPARFAIGAAIPSERDEGGIDGYHCWAEFYAEGKWWPVDVSEANKYSGLSTYYFGHHPANRIELSRGRDLIVEPGPASGAINFLADPVLEIAG